MANILKRLNINGAEYNIGYSQNDLTDELKAKYDASQQNAIDASAVTVSEAAGSGDILKTYTFTQNGNTIGTINLAKDLVVSGGSIVEVDGVKYLRLSIANQESPVDIAVTDLVDVYKGSAYIDIAADNTVSVKFADLDAALLAESAQVGAAIKANAAAAAAAKTAADNAQTAADNAQAHSEAVRSDLGAADAAAGSGTAFARIKSLEAEIESLSGGAGSIANQIDEKISAYDTATVQPVAARVKAIEDDYLTSADKEELQTAVDGKVAQADYDTKMAALDKSVADNATAIGNNAEAIGIMGEKLAGISTGANKTTYEYVESTATLNIVTA